MITRENNDLIHKLDIGIYEVSIFVIGLVLPIILICIIKFTGQSEIVEEIAKTLVVLFVILKASTWKLRLEGAMVFALLFGFSESMFYLANLMGPEDHHVFLLRFVTTVPMHMVTVLIIFLFAELRKYLLAVGFVLATLVHLLFNFFV